VWGAGFRGSGFGRAVEGVVFINFFGFVELMSLKRGLDGQEF